MAKYYAFSKYFSTFSTASSLDEALALAGRNEKRVFMKVDGIPNPWWVHPVKNGKVDKSVILKEIPTYEASRNEQSASESSDGDTLPRT